ncbi:MAG: hypothetical protein IIB88_05165, partial [Chloroflexi bacterium]|nr:hypothetical protein [Chloroflexota bacterium]
LRGGDDDDPQVPVPTSTAIAIPATPTAAPSATATEVPAATPAGSFSTPDDAVASFVQDGLGGVYIGECPPSVPSGENTLEGICSIELYRSTELATFNIGPFGSEALGEAVVIPDVDGRWTLVFLNFPPLDAQLTIGLDAMVFQAEDCLRFRPQPDVALEPASCQIDGTNGKLVDGPVEADGLTWWRLEGLGWASDSFLAPVE